MLSFISLDLAETSESPFFVESSTAFYLFHRDFKKILYCKKYSIVINYDLRFILEFEI